MEFVVWMYHATRIHLYEGFYKAEKGQGMAVERITELVTHKTIYTEICLQLYFIKENYQRLMDVLTSLQAKETPLACTVYNLLEDLHSYLRTGVLKTSLGPETTWQVCSRAEEKTYQVISDSVQTISSQTRRLLGLTSSLPALQSCEDFLSTSAANSWKWYWRLQCYQGPPESTPWAARGMAHLSIVMNCPAHSLFWHFGMAWKTDSQILPPYL